MSNAGGGGALENFDMQGRLGDLLATLGADQTEGTKEVKSTTLATIKDTTSASDNSSETSSSIDPSNPSLIPPNTRKFTQNGGGFFGSGGGASETTASNGIIVPEGTVVTEELQQLIDFSLEEPGVKALFQLVGDEKVTLALLNEYFEAEGIPTPVPPGHGKMEEAAFYGLEKFFTEADVSSPDAKAKLVIGGTSATKLIVSYFDFVSTIDPAGKTINNPEGMQKIDQYLLSAEDLVAQIVEELTSGASLPGEAPEGILSYLKFISELVAELRQTLAKLSFEDSETAGKVGVLMSQVSDMKRESVIEKFENMYEMMKLQESMKYVEGFMKILNPIMGSFTIVVAMIMLPINPVIGLVLLGIAIAWFVIMTTLEQTGKMDDLFEEINERIESAGGGLLQEMGMSKTDSEGWSRAIFWITFIVVIVVFVAVLGAAPFVGAMIPALLMPMIMTVLSESGILDLIMDQFQDLTGISDIWKGILSGALMMVFSLVVMMISEISGIIREIATEIIKLVVTLVIEIIVLIVKAVISALTAGVGAVVSAILYVIKIVLAVLKTVMTYLKILSQALKFLITIVTKMTKLVLEAVKKLVDAVRFVAKQLQSIMEWVKKAVEYIKKLFNEAMEKLESISKEIRETIKTVKESAVGKALKQIQDLFKQAKEYLDKVKDKATQIVARVVLLLDGLLKATNQGVQAVVSIGLGGLQLKLAELTEEEGELEYLIKILTDLIKSLEALLAKIQGKSSGDSGGDEFTIQIKELAKMFQQLVENMSGITDELAAGAVV